MINNIIGEITYADAQFIVVECGGIGFKCFASLNTLKTIGKVGSNVNIFTYLSVKEDALDLYGFAEWQRWKRSKCSSPFRASAPRRQSPCFRSFQPISLHCNRFGGR